jgi:hypothetical protein
MAGCKPTGLAGCNRKCESKNHKRHGFHSAPGAATKLIIGDATLFSPNKFRHVFFAGAKIG